jgi:hypothetical protein
MKQLSTLKDQISTSMKQFSIGMKQKLTLAMKGISHFFHYIRFVFITIVLVFVVILAVVIGMNFSNNFDVVRKTDTDVSGILERVKQISQLDTVELYYNEILDYRSSIMINEFELPFTEKSFIFLVKAKVQSGIDLASLTEDDIQVSKKKITITLDKAVITSKEILEYKAYTEKDGLFNPVTNQDTLNMLNEFLVRLEKQALENDIIEKAEVNAKLTLENFFSLVGYTEVVIRFRN